MQPWVCSACARKAPRKRASAKASAGLRKASGRYAVSVSSNLKTPFFICKLVQEGTAGRIALHDAKVHTASGAAKGSCSKTESPWQGRLVKQMLLPGPSPLFRGPRGGRSLSSNVPHIGDLTPKQGVRRDRASARVVEPLLCLLHIREVRGVIDGVQGRD